MKINEEELKLIIESVLNKLEGATLDIEMPESLPISTLNQDGIFDEVNAAVDAAEVAHLELIKLTLEKRREIIRSIRKIIISNLEEISKLAVEETTFGRVEDKIEKNRLAALKTPGIEDLEPIAYTDDNGMTLTERAAYGVIGSIIPSTNPTSTIINNGISMIAGGNTVVFNPHPMAKRSSCFTVSLINQAIVKAGGPPNTLCAIANPTIDSAQTLMKHPKIRLLVVTGGPEVVKVAMNSGKKVIAAGPGNPPCVVDETADLEKAARDIVKGAGFDNNIVCVCEKEILAVSQITDRLKEEMIKNGAYELKGEQIEKVTKLVIADPGKPGHEGTPNKKYIGKNASVIARDIGLNISDQVKILLGEVDRYHPLVWTEQLMPVIPLVRFNSVDEAIDFAVQCEHNFRHTASIHSRNIAKLSKMAKLMNCSLFIKNGPCYSGLGFGGAGYASFTIATPTGEGLTRARTFTRERRCVLVGYFRIV
ncbi:MAG: aldehyde dehydrogenase EutE [bacterium]|uniref:Aldehyde dehydrogenase EutE n=1 Tax=Candidatus Infernicultor aquiphilus TaxID=1805029 RepID=A0A2M8CEW7_9BACT|nr:aldehyde dehydrogenase EutE [bacterium]PIW12556.1 MAG: aldehyde dehydrogenase EutE [Candidatus Atribacteria bacterium CG17_big_fil_post_rev_8_21_14_2_50_34_11]PJB57624.1 MAG: aldehyde dehydrogenase EutE [Candidatus Atribacteria bacterium CG_4_9_14_3_um_filter_33_16]